MRANVELENALKSLRLEFNEIANQQNFVS